MSLVNFRDFMRTLDGTRSGMRGAQTVRPVITTRQANSDPSRALVSNLGAVGAVSLNSASGGARFLWGISAPFGWDSAEWD
jgi:hypothetical protein